jgi:2-methylcitrate dehydratase PrpD
MVARVRGMTTTVEHAGVTSIGNPLETIARFVVDLPQGAVPDDALKEARRATVDYLGVAIAGAADPQVRNLARYARETFRDGDATLLVGGERLTPEAAAYVNAAAGHVLDFDDYNEVLGGHPTVVMLPAAIALAEAHGCSAQETLIAYVIGVEVAIAMGRCLNYVHYERGWHPTATLGIFGAAATACRLLGLDVPTTQRALSVAASFASGIKGNFGSFVKPLQVGFAASKGIHAARLAALGVTANVDVLRGDQSFPAVFNGAGSEVDWSPLDKLGRHFDIVESGLIVKLYPCCGSTHGAIDAMLDLRARDRLEPERIQKIEVFEHPRRLGHTNRPDPVTGLQAKFSVQYVTALAALTGKVEMADFELDRVRDPRLAAMVAKVAAGHLPAELQTPTPGRNDCFAATVRVHDLDGTVHSLHIAGPHGSSRDLPISDSKLEAKFIATSSTALGSAGARDGYTAVGRWFAGDIGVAGLMSALSRGRG